MFTIRDECDLMMKSDEILQNSNIELLLPLFLLRWQGEQLVEKF